MTPAAVPVRVLLFGPYRELAGMSEIRLDLPTGCRVDDLIVQLRSDPALTGIPEAPAVAVNRVYVDRDEILRPGDEIALIPPVAGG
jgi:molybdopterin converting factor subunit 1